MAAPTPHRWLAPHLRRSLGTRWWRLGIGLERLIGSALDLNYCLHRGHLSQRLGLLRLLARIDRAMPILSS